MRQINGNEVLVGGILDGSNAFEATWADPKVAVLNWTPLNFTRLNILNYYYLSTLQFKENLQFMRNMIYGSVSSFKLNEILLLWKFWVAFGDPSYNQKSLFLYSLGMELVQRSSDNVF